MPIRYRIADVNDLECLTTLRCRFLAEAKGSPVDTELQCAIRQSFARQMHLGTTISWLGCDDQQIIATGSITFWERLPNRSCPNGLGGYIANMYTLPECRGQGIATAIFAKLVEEARRRDVHSLSLHALPAGAAIYKKAGFAFSEDVMSMHW